MIAGSGTEAASGVEPGAEFRCDVLVVGTGPGGMAATAAAAETGAEVHVVEALDEIGGNSVWSTGYMAFVNSRAGRGGHRRQRREVHGRRRGQHRATA